MKFNLKTIICVLLFLPLWFLAYAFLHEAGHALVGLAYGGTIKSFVFWNLNAHVRIVNVEYTVFGVSLMHIAGLLLPLIACALAAGFYSVKVKFTGYHICHFLASITIIGSMILWVVMSFRSLFTVFPPGEDVVNFLDTTSFHPLIVALGILFLTGAYTIFCAAKGMYAKNLSFFYIGKVQADDKTSRKRALNKAAIGLLFATALALTAAVFVSYEPLSIFNTSDTIADARIESDRIYTFSVQKERQYFFSFEIRAQGPMTGIIIQNDNGHRYFSWAVAETVSTIGLGLSQGVYTVQFIFLTDFDAAWDFMIAIGSYVHMDAEDIQNLRELFIDITDYSIMYSLRIR